jgi:hypothetical protein
MESSSAADTKEHGVDVAVGVNNNGTEGCYLILIHFVLFCGIRYSVNAMAPSC